MTKPYDEGLELPDQFALDHQKWFFYFFEDQELLIRQLHPISKHFQPS